jgi:hypothetical protein
MPELKQKPTREPPRGYFEWVDPDHIEVVGDVTDKPPSKAWDESQHPREPAGSPEGGQFTGDGDGGGSSASPMTRDAL